MFLDVLKVFLEYNFEAVKDWETITFIFLFLGILMLFRGGSIIRIWFSFSFSLLATIIFIENKKRDLSLKYVFVQEMSTWATLFRLLFNNRFFISLRLIIKLGLPPFHWWFQELVIKNPRFRSWLLGPRKLIPGFAFIFFFSQKFLILIFFSLLFSLLLLGGGRRFYPTLIFSSSFNTLLFFCYSRTSFYSSFFYFFLYSIFLFFFLYLSEGKKDSSWEVMLVIRGLPPGFIFF